MEPQPGLLGKDFWENHYGQSERVWSGKVNTTLAEVLEELAPAKALDLGCGEGGDALWLASRGWQVTGVDISETAVARARSAAGQLPAGSGQVEFLVADLETWDDEREFDLITLSFFHAPFEFQRTAILRRALGRLAPGGHLVVLSHGSHPKSKAAPGHDHGQQHGPNLVTVDSELRSLGVPADDFEVLQARSVARQVTGPDGHPTSIDDVIVVLRRAA